ncbi:MULTISPECIES: acyl-CoA dehydrogenase family protein [Kitasatospora]|uniref:acyl-CoA dehydrogenase family protein n=1 Tax=Kitasatospora TaxID=2063 RepID=UPI0004C35FB9|nr:MULTISPECIES: acyl-CoA dehydrogenase family protein [unclassified Kitasatospora]WAL75063.1 acyl-CoA dehydrogenase family protein [Kitasatospora sp. YST-16]WNW41120.1 acyl-CoA dehydrogenase family protein [Streptomyces sp. Li-HN-5-13]
MATAAPAGRPDPLDLLGVDELLTEDERLVRDSVRAFTDRHVRPHLADWYERGTFPVRELAPELGKLGVLGMHLEGYGCTGSTATEYGVACMELEAADSGLRSFVSVQGSLAMRSIHAYGSEEQKRHWLPELAAGRAVGCFGLTEPEAGSDPASMRTRARRDGGDWILDGAKMWITNGSVSDVAVVWAGTEDGVRGFLVPRGTPGLTARDIPGKLSLRASVTSELAFDGVRLPADAQLPQARGLRAPLASLGEARYGILWGTVGAARDCYRAAVDYARDRVQFGRPIGGFQLTQAKLVDMALELEKAYLVAVRIGRLKDAGRAQAAHISFGKLNNVRTALEIARTARTILGANGITTAYPVLRHANNLESVLTYEGTSEVHTLVLGEAITGESAYR